MKVGIKEEWRKEEGKKESYTFTRGFSGSGIQGWNW